MTEPTAPTPVTKVRLRFAKADDLRFLSHHDLMTNMLQGSDPSDDHANQKGSLIDGMVPLSTIVAGVEQFKANYRGPNHERIVAMLDQGLAELKSRYGEEIPVHELREFIKAKRQQLFSEFS